MKIRHALIATAVLVSAPAATVAVPVVSVTVDGPAAVASARPVKDDPERGCPDGYRYQVAHCEKLHPHHGGMRKQP